MICPCSSPKVQSDIAAFHRAFAGERERSLNDMILPWQSSVEQDAVKQKKANKNRSKNARKRIPVYNSEVSQEVFGQADPSWVQADEKVRAFAVCIRLQTFVSHIRWDRGNFLCCCEH